MRKRLATVLGADVSQLQVQAVHGGDINQAYRLIAGNKSWFVKINAAANLPMFEAEQQGLQQLADTGAIRVPATLGIGVHEGQSFLLLEFIEMRAQPCPRIFAEGLAALHQYQAERFGNDYDNTIGLTPQSNTWQTNWIEFWREQRLGLQIRLGGDRGLDRGLLKRLASLQSGIDGFFIDYQPRPSLLHGDLWSGNWSADIDGQPVIYDPACYFGDHEADLAMMELFGQPGELFFRAYHDHFPIDPGYRHRKLLYNLYHIVNHALLFGGGYNAQAITMVDRLLAELH